MSAAAVKEPNPIRLVFELARADHPRLYDDLIQFHKGTKRVNRLRLLAYDGLLVQNGLFVGGNHGPANGAQDGGGAVTNALFGPSLEG
ncbi:MAG: hypothetical protein WAO76_06950 [Georgfuchsia sp.]